MLVEKGADVMGVSQSQKAFLRLPPEKPLLHLFRYDNWDTSWSEWNKKSLEFLLSKKPELLQLCDSNQATVLLTGL